MRIGFVLLAIASGVMVFVYAMAWLLIPMEGENANIYSRAVNDRRGIRLIAAILVPLLIASQLITSTLHVAFVGFIGWPTFLAVGVVILIWRNANETERAFIDSDVVPILGGDTPMGGAAAGSSSASSSVSSSPRAGSPSSSRGTRPSPRCGRSAVPCWSSRRASSSSGPGG